MIWADYVIIGLAIMTLLIGVWQGLILQAYSLLCWLLAVLVGLGFSLEFTMFLTTTINDASARLAASYILLCAITVTVGGLIRLILGQALTSAALTTSHRLVGMVLGLMHSLIFVFILVLLAGLSVLPQSSWWNKSRLIPPFQATVIWLHDHLSFDITKRVRYR